MKLRNTRFTALSILGLSLLAGCSYQQMVKMAEEQELKVNPSPLELHGDSVKFDLSATLPLNMLKKNRLYTLKTYYRYGTSQDLDQIEFQDTEFPNQKVEQPKMNQKFSFAYNDDMERGDLVLVGVASNIEKTKFKQTEELPVAKGIITTSRLVRDAYSVAYAPHAYNNQEELIPTNVSFFFLKGRADLRSSEVSGDEGKKLDAFIASKFKTRTVTIYGSHSPEGLESINSKLAEQRAKVIRDFYHKKMKQYDYKKLADSIKFEVKAVFQNWDAFKKQLNASSSFSNEEKQAILAIVNKTGSNFIDQEKELSKLPSYKKLTDEIYPKLRISKTEIFSVKEKKSDAEINILAKAIIEGKAKPDTLSFDEIMYAATMTPILEEKAKIYEAATKVEKSWTAHNNLGAVHIDMALKVKGAEQKALVEKALVQFQLANNLKETAEALNNIGLCQMILKNKDKASESFQAALKAPATSESVKAAINAGVGSIYIKFGLYNEAISSLSKADENTKDVLFNLGLAQLLNKDYKTAEKTFEKAVYVNKEDALAFYCGAISDARLKKIAEVATNLQEAFKIKPDLKEKAANDLEFESIKNDEQFKAALK